MGATRYASRWAIEVCFRDVKQDLGGHQPQSWKRRGPERAAARCRRARSSRRGRSDAGVVAYGRLEDVPVEVFDGVLETNLHGSVNLARHVLPVGSLVLVGSLIGHLAVPDMSAYVLSKWGVRALVRQLRVDNRDCPGIRVGFSALPWAYDRLVGPLFRVVAQDLTRVVVHGPGNVLSSQQQGNALRGGWGNALAGVARNLGEFGRRRSSR